MPANGAMSISLYEYRLRQTLPTVLQNWASALLRTIFYVSQRINPEVMTSINGRFVMLPLSSKVFNSLLSVRWEFDNDKYSNVESRDRKIIWQLIFEDRCPKINYCLYQLKYIIASSKSQKYIISKCVE